MKGHKEQYHHSFLAQWIMHVLGLMVLSTVVVFFLYTEYKNVKKRELSHLICQSDIVFHILQNKIATLDKVLKDLQIRVAQASTFKVVTEDLQLLADALNGVSELSLLDANGIVRASNRPQDIGTDARDKPYFKAILRARDPNRLYLCAPFASAPGVYTMTAGRMLVHPDGTFAGMLNATLDRAFFAPLLESMLYASDMWVDVAHGNGTVSLAIPSRAGVVGKDLAKPGTLFSRHRASGRKQSVFHERYPTGQARLLIVRTLRFSDPDVSSPLVIGLSRDEATLYKAWRKDLLLHVGALAAVAVLSTLALLLFQKWQRENEQNVAEAMAKVRERDRFIRTVMDNSPSQIAYWNADLHCEYANSAYLAWFGKTYDGMLGISVRELLGEAAFAESEPFLRRVLQGEPQLFERVITRPDGSLGYNQVRYIPDVVENQVRGMFVLASDVSELKATQQELEQRVRELDILATTDPLTGIGNRRAFLERFIHELARSQRYGHPIAFLLLDVDHFKVVNDTYGHDVGDDVLKALAMALRQTVREVDVIGRLGGEEFGALLVQADRETAWSVAERIRQVLCNTCIPLENASLCFTVSIGMAISTDGQGSVDALMKRADLALYRAKQTGRDKVCCYGEFEDAAA